MEFVRRLRTNWNCALLGWGRGAGVPDIAVEHPGTFFLFPDHYIFARVDEFVVGAVERVFSRFLGQRAGGFHIDRFQFYFFDAGVIGAFPEIADGAHALDEIRVGRADGGALGIERCHGAVALAEELHEFGVGGINVGAEFLAGRLGERISGDERAEDQGDQGFAG
jgi:hypothetical protein